MSIPKVFIALPRFLVTLCILLSGGMSVSAQSAHQFLRKGDQAYDKKEYQNAENAYRQALTQSPSDPTALYNTGNTAYRQGHYEDAVGLYTEAEKQAKDAGFKASALYNLGNTQLQQQQYDKAIEAYEQSLRLRPGNANTKSNLQFAKKKQREKEQQEKQKQQQQQQPNDQNDQQNQQDKQPPSDQEQPPQNQPQQPKNQDQQQDQSGQDKQQQSPQPGRITPQQARQFLDNAIGPADQKSARQYRQNLRPTERPRAKKDW